MIIKHKTLASIVVILILFAFAVLIRLPHLGRPIRGHHEWITAHTMLILQNWEARGALKHKFRLLMTSPNDTDISVMHDFKGAVNDQGHSYYVSFPPGAAVIPYLIFKTLSIPITILNLEIMNMFFHLISAFFFFFFLIKVLSPSSYSKEMIALCGMFFFFILPPHLWFFSNTYSWDIFWYYVFIAALAATLDVIDRIETGKPCALSLLTLGAFLFLLIYSDFYGLLYTLTATLFAAFQLRRNKAYTKVIGVILVSSFLGLGLILAQYGSINGLETRFSGWLDSRQGYIFRGMQDIKDIFDHIKACFSFILITIGLITAYLLFRKGKGFFTSFSKIELTALYLSLFPAMIFIPFMPRWSAEHDYSMLRLSAFLIILFVILLNKAVPSLTNLKRIILIAVLILASVDSIHTFKKEFTHARHLDFYKEAGEMIKENVHDDEVIFSINNLDSGIDPRFLVYIQRNIQTVKSPEEARDALMEYKKPKGVIVYVDKKEGFLKAERISVNEGGLQK